MIVTVTLNPTLDRTLSVPKLELGSVHRGQIVREDLGGKGINVSRALRALGIPSHLVAFMGGLTGRSMQRSLQEAGFEAHFVEVAGETRRNITLFDEASGQYTKINEPGPSVGSQHLAALVALIDQLAGRGDLWAFCGSLPPGAPADLYARLIQQVQNRGGRACLDSSGPPLSAGLGALPFAVKPNCEEAAELLGRPLRAEDEYCVAVRQLQAPGVALVALTCGRRGLVLAMDGDVVVASPPSIPARSPVGAGDAALAGLLWAVSERCETLETARRIVACGTAAAMQEGTGVGDRALVARLLSEVQVAPR